LAAKIASEGGATNPPDRYVPPFLSWPEPNPVPIYVQNDLVQKGSFSGCALPSMG